MAAKPVPDISRWDILNSLFLIRFQIDEYWFFLSIRRLGRDRDMDRDMAKDMANTKAILLLKTLVAIAVDHHHPVGLTKPNTIIS